MQLKLHNTLTKQLDVFEPIDECGKKVTFYSCGPTVYDFAHIGNFRAFLNADVLRRTLELLGYTVNQVMNITDVGHMTDDAVADGGGEDKMLVAATRLAESKKSGSLPEGITVDPTDPMAIAEFYANAFIQDSESLGIRVVEDARKNPSCMPRPTQYIQEMITMVESLIEKGHAYVASDGVVYFSVDSFTEYGELSGNTLDTLRSGEGGRVDMNTQAVKKNPADFMLWKPDATHLMRWQSPWGEGYPGWHLECSVMANTLLGTEIDLHSGGEDNIFPHHECEIAQSRCATGCETFARYWFHTRFLLVDGGKMSKSKGNFYTLRDLVEKGASAAAVRLELIKTHYRSNANFTLQGLKDSQRQIDRWRRLKDWLVQHQSVASHQNGPLALAKEQFLTSLCDDMNVAGAIGALNEAVNKYNVDAPPSTGGESTLVAELESLLAMDSVLGVLDLDAKSDSGTLDIKKIDSLIEARLVARHDKEWARADEIRDELLGMGIAIKDGPSGTTWTRIVQ
ncbi:MAG: cysteine--tRNA ligase [Phycisphaerales bacterium]|jgi:cysteinyl-tRNA synthetase|nr:cysteine--tRNA ligase [Phycisphaerales bacterium]